MPAAAARLHNRSDAEQVGETVWDICRVQAHPRLDDLAQRVDSGAAWDDLILPEAQQQALLEILTHVRHRKQVYENWGFAAKTSRGLGIMIKTASDFLQTDIVVLGIFVIALVAIAFEWIVRIAEKLLVPWHGKA